MYARKSRRGSTVSAPEFGVPDESDWSAESTDSLSAMSTSRCYKGMNYTYRGDIIHNQDEGGHTSAADQLSELDLNLEISDHTELKQKVQNQQSEATPSGTKTRLDTQGTEKSSRFGAKLTRGFSFRGGSRKRVNNQQSEAKPSENDKSDFQGYEKSHRFGKYLSKLKSRKRKISKPKESSKIQNWVEAAKKKEGEHETISIQYTEEYELERPNYEIQKVKEDNDNLMKVIQSQQDINIDLTTKMQHLQEENYDLTLQIQCLQKESVKTKKENINKDAIIQALQDDINNLQTPYRNSQMGFGTHKIQCHGAGILSQFQPQEENSHLNNEIQKLQQDKYSMTNPIQQIREEMMNSKMQMQQLLQEIHMVNEMQELRQENKSGILQPQQDNHHINNEYQPEQNTENYCNEIQQLREEWNYLQNTMQKCQQKINVLNNEIKRILAEKSKMNSDIQSLQHEKYRLTLIVFVFCCVVSLQENNDDMKKDIQQLPQENTIKNDEILQLQRENTNKNNEIQQVRQDNTNKNNEILQLQHDNTNKNHEILQLQQENTNKNNEIEQLQQENTNKNDEIEQLRQQYTNKNNEILQIQRDNTNKNDEVQQLREENTKKNDEIGQLRQQYTNKNNEILQLQQDNANKNNEVQQLRQENTNKNGEIEQLLLGDTRKNNEIRQLRQENSTITESGSVVISNEKLGTGAYGAVYIGNFYGTKVAVKQYHTIILSQYNRKILQREIKIASQCRHPNLLQFICATQNDQDHLVIVTELMDESLRDLLERHARESSQLRNQEVKLTSLDVARGLNYIHSKTPNPIVHRDVSSANVLLWIVNGAVIRAKISDYGSANFLQVCNTANPGAAIYAAPEARHSHQDPKIDVFSYGLLVCEISICELPDEVEREGQIEEIRNVEIKELVKRCTELEPQQRPTMQDVIECWENME